MIQTLKRDGYVRPHSFTVTIPTPPALLSQKFNDLNGNQVSISTLGQIFRVRADSCHVPGLLFPTSDTFRYGIGPLQKMPFGIMYTDAPMTFILDGKGIIWNYFYAWANLIFGFAANMNNVQDPNQQGGGIPNYCVGYRDDYEVNLMIEVFDPMGGRVITIRLNHAWPSLMQDTPLNWGDNNTLAKLGVYFSYRDWEIVPEGSSTLSDFDAQNQAIWGNQSQPEFWIGGRPPGRVSRF